MKLSDSQVDSVRKWLNEGCDVSQIQKQISSQFNVSMTYMDVRFLIDDIGAELHVPHKAPVEKDLSASQPKNAADSDSSGEVAQTDSLNDSMQSPEDGFDNADSDSSTGGEVMVALGEVQRPGALAGGTVIFSDGGKAEWVLDQSGQLGLIPEVKGYQAPKSDMPAFQRKLQELLGMAEEEPPAADPNRKPVEVTLSKIQRPDCLAFGDVTFSNGATAEWRLDRTGQLGLVPSLGAEKPPREDMPEFQRKLQMLLKDIY